ncbi:MAG: 30S ribosome-binding factor RbfA [Anaerolineaceae bacterium]|nr:30S ribosome-binding factor RbfA [Anaerolineaceae bacterium]
MPSKIRIQRIADRIYQDLSELMIYQIQDPRVAGVNVTDVKVDRELTYADIYVSALEGESRSKEVLQGLEHASGFIRSYLAKRIQLRSFPQLRFHWDPTPERADRIEQMLAELRDKGEFSDSEEAADGTD